LPLQEGFQQEDEEVDTQRSRAFCAARLAG
jgi:hypothetical protein